MPVGPFPFIQAESTRPRRSPADASLQPTFPDRFAEILRPGWSRIVRIRRIAAALLAIIAVALALRGDPHTDQVGVVVAARDLTPGHILTADDLARVDRDASGVVAGTLHEVDEAVGRILAGPVPTGEPLVDTRLLGPRLAVAATGFADARVVPIRLADAGVGELLREGDRVDVLTVSDTTDGPLPGAHVLARGAVVVLAESGGSTRERNERVVLVALEPEPATAVAAASLVSALTVTLH
ncbi:SAF domain-containing protein [Rhodococcus sp. NPDC047139]|uniref:SAF domain-containing protein n=1 Tax=Rhodococcus sp. NPDC047139 TaxID=3155141 RepID=UPI0033DEEAD5